MWPEQNILVLDSDSAAARFKEKYDEVAMFDVRMLARNIGDLIIIKKRNKSFASPNSMNESAKCIFTLIHFLAPAVTTTIPAKLVIDSVDRDECVADNYSNPNFPGYKRVAAAILRLVSDHLIPQKI